jgi:hypothetical protein
MSSPVPVLTRKELETPRTAAHMLAWVDAAHARFNTRALRAEARRGKRFADRLVLEARPMALFAFRYFDASPNVVIQHVLGNQNYDGIVDDRRPQPDSLHYLEVTTTLKTYEESLRMELLTQQGHAPAYGRVIAQGPRHSRRAIRAEGGVRDHRQTRAEHLALVENAVARKAKKDYEPNTALIVAVDDSVPFRDPDDVEALRALATRTLAPMLKGTGFSLLALEGSNGVDLRYPLRTTG